MVEWGERRLTRKFRQLPHAVREAGAVDNVLRHAGEMKLLEIPVDLQREVIDTRSAYDALQGRGRTPIVEHATTWQRVARKKSHCRVSRRSALWRSAEWRVKDHADR